MPDRWSASQNAWTRYSRLTGLCSGVCVAEFVVITVVWYELLSSSPSSTKKPTAIFLCLFFFLVFYTKKVLFRFEEMFCAHTVGEEKKIEFDFFSFFSPNCSMFSHTHNSVTMFLLVYFFSSRRSICCWGKKRIHTRIIFTEKLCNLLSFCALMVIFLFVVVVNCSSLYPINFLRIFFFRSIFLAIEFYLINWCNSMWSSFVVCFLLNKIPTTAHIHRKQGNNKGLFHMKK